VAAKTTEPHPRLPGTIHTAAAEIEAAGGRALPLTVDVRDLDTIIAAVEKAKTAFGGIDILVNNASAISLTGTLETPIKRFDLMFSVNVRATFACSQACLPHLKRAQNPHILNLAPPLDMCARWFKDHCAYTMSKYGLGMAEEFKQDGVAVNALWPRTVINTAAVAMLDGRIKPANCRIPEIVAEAAYAILTRDAKKCTGNFFIDDEVLAEEGIRDLERYAVAPGGTLVSDLFVD
jgi:citronellol/citronellal dehydrogenase